MATNRKHNRLSRTLLILLGIILACLLTLNARSLYSADLLSGPTKKQNLDVKASKTFLDQIGTFSFKNFRKKTSSLN